MNLISEGIDKVKAFKLPAGIWADGSSFDSPGHALVKWESSWVDKFYQVYINGYYAGSAIQTNQHQIIVGIPTSLQAAVKIEIFAVNAEDIYTDFSDELDSSISQSGRIKFSLLRDQNLPIDSKVQIYFNNGSGQIDYSKPINNSPIHIWSCWNDKCGFGMSRFGLSDFGYDSAAAVGFAKGWFGYGQFGLDADTLTWVSPELAAGTYKFGIKIIDSQGNESNVSETDDIVVIPAAKPAEQLNIFSFDKVTNQLILNIV